MKKITLQWKQCPYGALCKWQQYEGFVLYGFRLPSHETRNEVKWEPMGYWSESEAEIVKRRNPYDCQWQTVPKDHELVEVDVVEPKIGD